MAPGHTNSSPATMRSSDWVNPAARLSNCFSTCIALLPRLRRGPVVRSVLPIPRVQPNDERGSRESTPVSGCRLGSRRRAGGRPCVALPPAPSPSRSTLENHGMRRLSPPIVLSFLLLLALSPAAGADRRYFVQSYTPYLAPAGNLELETITVARSGQNDLPGTEWQS